MENKIYGYVRVSSQEQNEDRQLLALNEVGVKQEWIYVDKQSGKGFNRPNYKRLLRKPLKFCYPFHLFPFLFPLIYLL